ncbi:MAG: cysteine--tRNA ligase [Gammaproteobacteria bacterium]|nr:cysteine--tRNA ligase [Gammaproteobacteria bacterium]
MLHIHNSLTKQKERFTPIEPGKVKLYVCGMTVYDFCHVGHARVMVVFDVVTRYLRASGYDVTYIRNITDIDDKIIARANENNETIQALTEQFITEMHRDADALGVERPTAEPKATEAISEMLAMIETLIDKGLAYAADNGDVYYDVSEFPDYGKLSGRNIEELRAGERVAVNESKQDPMDFVLWKGAKPEEPSWDSPWGKGRPGWHIECSAMSADSLGKQFDIHGGGQDLQFPHHENEIAQSEGAHGCQYVNYWMHNGFVRIADEKMSKSLGNFFTVREVLEQYDAEVVRYFILTSHYRSPLNYSEEQLDQAKNTLTKFYSALRYVEIDSALDWQQDTEFAQRFKTAMDDDFNTALALSVMSDVRQVLNKPQVQENAEQKNYYASLLVSFGRVLGLFQQTADTFLAGASDDDVTEIEDLINQRNQARVDKDWTKADQVRDKLTAMGIILEDAAGKTSWRR